MSSEPTGRAAQGGDLAGLGVGDDDGGLQLARRQIAPRFDLPQAVVERGFDGVLAAR